MRRSLALVIVLLVAVLFGYYPLMIAIGEVHVQWLSPDANQRNYMGLIGGGVMAGVWMGVAFIVSWPRKKRLQGKG